MYSVMAGESGRQTAVKMWISDILSGQFVKGDKDTPSYVAVRDRKVSRVNIIATVVSEPELGILPITFIVDDGSGRISCRSFEQKEYPFTLGDIVLVIGRIREFGELYIAPEIVKKIDSIKWVELRRQELKKNADMRRVGPQSDEKVLVEEEAIGKPNTSQNIVSLIRELDTGNGVDIEEIIARLGADAARAVDYLLQDGEVFEVSPGKLKVLD